ncbi:hypothetical protein DDR33_07250 [Pararcticibacter amylolyticus]|uniref:Uncharacterized protein n=1 Tax=Pararcticibacter amylolyticus TaxID=2173175 RepID=A0A2U2PIE1_9SPHI|nr:hypothetical protein DDR33_07250 [Pararcticibacter amylolyticus]
MSYFNYDKKQIAFRAKLSLFSRIVAFPGGKFEFVFSHVVVVNKKIPCPWPVVSFGLAPDWLRICNAFPTLSERFPYAFRSGIVEAKA